jgi:membrane protein implicated in regulation of membrane protease activity
MLFELANLYSRWIWAGLIVLFSLIEIFTFGLTTIWFALAALLMVFISFFPIPFEFQLLIFLSVSAVLLIFTRPLAVKKFKIGKEKTNVDSLIGKHALVTKQITEFERGQVKLNGLIWSAKPENNSTLPEGSKCEVVRIEGVQAVVRLLQEN